MVRGTSPTSSRLSRWVPRRRNFSDLLEAIQVLARRPISQTSSSYPFFDNDWADGADVTECYDMDDHHDADDDGYHVSGSACRALARTERSMSWCSTFSWRTSRTAKRSRARTIEEVRRIRAMVSSEVDHLPSEPPLSERPMLKPSILRWNRLSTLPTRSTRRRLTSPTVPRPGVPLCASTTETLSIRVR